MEKVTAEMMTREELIELYAAGERDFRGADLSGMDLSGMDLSGMDLSLASLSWTNLRGANLSLASLSLANLSWANLSLASLSLANLSLANLRGTNLGGSDLGGSNLIEADLRETNLRRSDLSETNLEGIVVNWQSHDLIAEILIRAAGEDAEKRSLAGLVLVSREWCWEEFLAVEHSQREWALAELSKWVRDGDGAPEVLLAAKEHKS